MNTTQLAQLVATVMVICAVVLTVAGTVALVRWMI
jgi:hypothetical protein